MTPRLGSSSRHEHVSLRKELGIEEVYDGSPHRFFDWAKDGPPAVGADDPKSFLTVEQQIRERNERLKWSELALKEEEAAKKQRRRERRDRKRRE